LFTHQSLLLHYCSLTLDISSSQTIVQVHFNRLSNQQHHISQYARLHLRLRYCVRRRFGSGTFFASQVPWKQSLICCKDSSSVDYLTQTNSLGVVTGMPAVETSIASQPAAVTTQPAVVTEQPAAITTQPAPADIPAVGPGVHTLTLAGTGSMVNSSRTLTVTANNSTTLALVAATTSSGADSTNSADATDSDASGSKASKSASGTGSAATGAAVNVKAAAGSILGFGAFMAAFL
jgi:hypothetical protein